MSKYKFSETKFNDYKNMINSEYQNIPTEDTPQLFIGKRIKELLENYPEDKTTLFCVASFYYPELLVPFRKMITNYDAIELWKEKKVSYNDETEIITFLNAISHTKIVKHFSKDLEVGKNFEAEKMFKTYPEVYLLDIERKKLKDSIEKNLNNKDDFHNENENLTSSFKI